jgi:hypothetical protein
VSLYERVLAKRRALLGAEHHHTLATMNNLASAYQAGGQLARALPMYEQSLAILKARLARVYQVSDAS